MLSALASALVGAAPAVAGAGCHQPLTEGSGVSVVLSEQCFGPTILRVKTGQRVTWLNKDAVAHVVAGAGYHWGSPGDLLEGDRFSTLFRARGVYPYTCFYHPGMNGAVIVGDAVPSDTGLAEIDPVSDANRNAQPDALTAAVKASSTRPVAVRTSAGTWPVISAVGFALAFVLGLVLILQRRAGRRPPDPEA
jgi:plastocyanin